MILAFHGARPVGAHRAIETMHRDRKHVFVDLLRWDVPIIDGMYEIDQFDGDRAVYLVAVEADGTHRGSIRLLPSDGEHILGSVFPGLCQDGVPRSPDIYEISRGCVSPRLRAPERLAVRNALTTAAVEYALLHRIEAFTCIADSGWLSRVLALGWDCWPLGLPEKIGRAMTGALRIDIRSDTLQKLRDAGTYAHSAIVMAPATEKVAA